MFRILTIFNIYKVPVHLMDQFGKKLDRKEKKTIWGRETLTVLVFSLKTVFDGWLQTRELLQKKKKKVSLKLPNSLIKIHE